MRDKSLVVEKAKVLSTKYLLKYLQDNDVAAVPQSFMPLCRSAAGTTPQHAEEIRNEPQCRRRCGEDRRFNSELGIEAEFE
jgi:hypothetical protein